jgi:predicted secreted protein with PEFG-CTERM motif
MLRISLLVLIVISIIQISSSFAEGTIELNSDQKTIGPNDTIFVYGKATGITKFIPVTVEVLAPDGEVVFSPKIEVDDNGEFKRLIHHPLPSFKIGTYTVIASHEDLKESARIQFNVQGESLIPTISPAPGTGDKVIFPGLEIEAEALEGSDSITITGTAVTRDTDVTFSVHSPQGNLVTVKQISPKADGTFSVVIKTGGPLWAEDGVYTVTANQGIASEFEDTFEVEIVKGRVIPEFGTIAAMILVVSIISIIAITAKSKLSILPRF